MSARVIADNDQIILAKLAEVENNPNTQWLTHEEVFGPIRERFEYEKPDKRV